MTRWTRNGWDVCLGGGLWKSWWNDQGGLDFLLETQARAACADELTFFQTVYRLQWLARCYFNEKTDVVRRNGQFDPNNPWYTLSMIQRQRIVKRTGSAKKLMFSTKCYGMNQLERISMRQARVVNTDTWCSDMKGAIVTPAASCLPSNKTMTVPSFLGGQQLFVKDDAEIIYEIDSHLLATHKHSSSTSSTESTLMYSLTCRVATAHRSEQSITLTVNNACTYTVPMPYTMSLWGVTTSITIAFDVTDCQKVTLTFRRPQQNFGFAFKEFLLTPA